MKKIILLALGMFLCLNNTNAQSEDHKWAIGVHAGKNEYSGDLGDAFFDWNKAFYGFIGVSVNRYLNPSFDLRLEGTKGRYGRWLSMEENFKGDKNDVTLLFSYKLNNGYLLPENSWLAPSIIAGPGIAFYNEVDHAPGRIDEEGLDILLTGGLGLRIQFSRRIALHLQSTYNMTNNDNRDLIEDDTNDKFLKHHAGFIVSLGKRPDSETPVDMVDSDEHERLLREEEQARLREEEERREAEARLRQEEEARRLAEEERSRAEEERLRAEEELRQAEMVNEIESGLDPGLTFVRFDFDKSDIKSEFHNTLDNVFRLMEKYPNLKIEVHGHTDSRGTANYNMRLSQRRADSVKRFLVARGINADRISTVAFGEERPRASNQTEEGMAINRRAEFSPVL